MQLLYGILKHIVLMLMSDFFVHYQRIHRILLVSPGSFRTKHACTSNAVVVRMLWLALDLGFR